MAMQAKKKLMKKAPAEKAGGGPPKHLAYITEEEAKLLDMILTIKKGAKGTDGKPLPQTYEPGQGSPTEFLTELTPQQINELLAKTDGTSETTPQGVESYAMFSENSSTTAGKTSAQKDSSYGGSVSANTNTGSSLNAGRGGSPVGSKTPDTSFGNGGVASHGNRETPGSYDRINTSTWSTGEPKSAQMQETERRFEVGRVRDQMSQYRSPPGTKATALDPSLRGRAQAAERSKVAGTGDSRPAASSIPTASELGRLVSGPGKTDRENVTTLTRDPKGPGIQRSSELGRLAVGSQFNTPLADNPGAYNESELANAVTGEQPRAIGATTFDKVSGIVTDPTSTMITNPTIRQSLGDQVRPAIAQPKVDREVPLTSAPDKTDRVRSIIMGADPIPQPKSSVLPFRNGVPDSSLSPLTTLTPPANDDLITSPSPTERTLMPSKPAPAPTPVPRSSLQDLITSPSPQERTLMPSRLVAAPEPIDLTSAPDPSGSGEFIDPNMPDISFDANQPSGTLFDPQPSATLGGDGGDGATAPVAPGTGPQPGPAPPLDGKGGDEYLPGIMPWDRADFSEIAKAYEAAGQTYTPQQFMAAFYNSQPYSIEHPAADASVEPSGDMSVDRFGGVMPWDRVSYDKLRKSHEAVGQTYTPEQFVTQFYSTPQAQAA